MDKNIDSDAYCEIICIVDMSGSMWCKRDKVISGLNELISDEKDLPGKAYLTLVLFNSKIYHVYDCKEISSVKPLSKNKYVPQGMTALYDAICETILSIKEQHEILKDSDANLPEKTILAIFTDGYENFSRKFYSTHAKAIIDSIQNEKNWEIIYFCTEGRSLEQALRLGLSKEETICYLDTNKGTQKALRTLNETISTYRSSI